MQPLTLDGGYCLGVVVRRLNIPRFDAFCHAGHHGYFSEARVSEMLRQLPSGKPGAVEVKSRGRLPGIETDRLQGVWSKAVPGMRTVLLFSYEKDVVAIAADRVPANRGPRGAEWLRGAKETL